MVKHTQLSIYDFLNENKNNDLKTRLAILEMRLEYVKNEIKKIKQELEV